MGPPTKRRKIEKFAVEEITFDLADRQEYLTGFHKRKLQRAKVAQEAAEKKARAEKIQERRRLREERKADLQRHIEEVNALLRPAVELEDSEDSEKDSGSEEEEWNGITEVKVPPVDHEAEYVDEEKYTTVTVEELDVSKEGLFKAEVEKDLDGTEVQTEKILPAPEAVSREKAKRKWTKEKPADKEEKAKKKKKKFRYESKAERRVSRFKEKSKNSKQAQARRAG